MSARTAPAVRARDAAALVDLAYVPDRFVCGHFVMLTQAELFGRLITLPTAYPLGRRGQAAVLGRLTAELAERVDDPLTGDVAMYEQDDADGGVHFHLGTVFVERGELWLLHLPANGRSVLQRETDVRLHGLRRVGFFRLLQETR
ncbi:MAG: hypothetical protein ACK44A_03685 [Roseateles sp.]